ncbi:iduronate 2-sulfatase [Galleria mellonella]|uniref:Iduronate 2-sulfatase n=1 Tax=Galleria mellonella TaxID=7137 RepID=A0A6J3BQ82_GALME|nr:iduronate 2-sulfatase [Galleria mellonella]XP_052751588.1 iduronate 2-sulfatase [Galleria mellonella]
MLEICVNLCFTILFLLHPYGASIQKHNVLIILIDDLRHLSDKDIFLPNIDKIAANGINFENAYAQQALCAPSRNSLLTGRRPDSLRLYDFYNYWRVKVGNFTTIPQFYKENGFETYSVGKVFHPGASSNFTDDYPLSWSHVPYHPPTEQYKDAAVCKDKETLRYQKNLICPVKVEIQPGKSLPDLESLEHAIRIINERNSSKPFMLAIGFHKPHIPLKFPKKYLERVPIQTVHPPQQPNKPEGLPTVSWHPWTDVRHRDDIKRLNISFPYGTMPTDWTLRIRQSYYAAATYIDDLVGKLMAAVNKNNTIVLLTSDHGWSLGENGLWAKYSNFNVALKVPLIFNVPGMPHKSIETPVELIDIFPTLAELSGLSSNIPKCTCDDKRLLCFEGNSLVSLMGMNRFNISVKSKSFALSQYPRPSVHPKSNSDKPRLKDIKIMGYSIKTKRFRYTEWISFNNTLFTRDWNKVYALELYDHSFDPEETKNVYLQPKYKRIVKYLSTILRSRVNICDN